KALPGEKVECLSALPRLPDPRHRHWRSVLLDHADNLFCLPVLTPIAKRRESLGSSRARGGGGGRGRGFGDGARRSSSALSRPVAFRRQLLEFIRKRNSGLRTEATAVALKLRLPSSRAVAAEITSGPVGSASMHYSLSIFGDHPLETTQTMNAIRSHHRGGSETLVYEPVARPVPHSGEVLV